MDAKLLLQCIGVALGLLYLWLEYRANTWLWVVGMVMPVVHGTLYFRSGLYADCSMQVYYVLASLYGLAVWLRRPAPQNDLQKGSQQSTGDNYAGIRHTPANAIAPLVVVYVLLHAGIYLLLARFTDSTVPFWDAMTTALCIIAMWMLSRKYLEQWLVWLVIDLITTALYIYKGIPITGSLYALYSVLAVVGYARWRRAMRQAQIRA